MNYNLTRNKRTEYGRKWDQHMGELNACLSWTLSLAGCAWTTRHRRPLARQLFSRIRAHSGRIICFGVRKLWPPSRLANVAETWLRGYSGNCQVDFVVS